MVSLFKLLLKLSFLIVFVGTNIGFLEVTCLISFKPGEFTKNSTFLKNSHLINSHKIKYKL